MQIPVDPEVRDIAQGEIRDQYLDAGKARETLQWRAEYPLGTGLRETVAWYRELLD
jgi:nucleoside-diphosphate-sugar epimerase